ncbi:putative LRR receptor-like serine/threonine-protein kinase [Morus notabilis]|uniref:non-specific serine/threonine protein kinase n=1 Tax=Morus notabilis TaxID=981085 RepID=W9R7L1_9ROSA|nr:putative LRR receptor-like serine/threonine-protein kinase [Morus notabilis]
MRTSWVKRPTFCNRIWWWSYILFYFSIFLVFSPQKCIAQNATTDPSEVRALNTIFRKWNVQANPMWNISGEPCTGSAVNNTIDVEQKDNNPSIKCNCTYDNNSTCHITHLRVQSLDAHGEIPEEITSLKYLTKIDLNYFTGTLPAFIGNLSALQILSVSHNDFYGTIPKEIGNLKNLIMIALGSNNFSGTLPPELGNLPNLELIYIDSCGLSGEIPPTFANLRSMRVLYTTDSPFSGKIPDFIGNWTNLTELRISDIYKGSSSLDFVRSLKKLKELILRNALVTGRISSYIEGLKSLETLFLGNNSLSGIIPSQWSDKLQNVVIPSLDCLQRNFPCNRDAPLYANLSIKCGGPQVRGKTGIVYEAENLYLGPAKFYVIDERWAVSKVGLFADKTGKLDIEGTRAEVSGATENPELFHTARMCPGSLRYYGLGLVNGNYTITLHFAEIGFPNRNSQKWAGLARRIFDIYIQGSLEQKDFEIAKEAGGVERAIVKKFHVTVSENYLEIHLFWAGKGTCCIPEQGYYGPLIAAIHVASDFTPTFSGIRETTQGDNKTGLILGITVPVVFVCLLLLAAVFYMRRKSNNEDEEVILGLGPQQNMFSYTELRAATEDFNPSNKIGEGGFGHVYKGTLSDGRFVALKQLSVASHHGRSQFLSEIATISVVQHRNLVKLYGCCIEGNRRILVYEYLENKSLDRALFGKNDLHLDWPTRFNICAGTARGLAYLHEESRPRIVHRDIKASNILLDEVLCPKISDFGLAKLYDDNKTHVSTRVAGTIGYLAPEYALRGHLTEKADVFGFGVVALEIVSGRPNFCNSLDNEKIYLLEWAWTLYENDQSLELMDPTLSEFDENEAIRLIRVALLCTQASPWLRPPMSRVVGMLSGDIEIDTAKSKPSYLTDLDFKDTTTSVFSSDTADTSHSSSKQSSHLFSYST